MAIVISAMPKWRFDAAEVDLPSDLDIRFIDPKAEDLIQACRHADCLLVPASAPAINAEVLRNISHIKLIQSAGAGFDRIDISTAAAFDIPVANVPGKNAKTVAEFTVGLLIALQRQLVLADREIKAGRYKEVRKNLFRQGLCEIEGSKVGLVGLGAIGRETAKILNMLGASVSYYAKRQKPWETEAELKVSYKPFQKLLAESDIVSLHVPLTEGTRGLIGLQELAWMRPGSLLVNTARGGIIEQQALAHMLETGHVGGAAIDVFDPEPPDPKNPLFTLSPAASNRVLVTPHAAGVTVQSMHKMLAASLENIRRVVNGQVPENIVNL